MDEVVSLYSSSGDHMILIECWFRNTEELTRFVESIERIKGLLGSAPR